MLFGEGFVKLLGLSFVNEIDFGRCVLPRYTVKAALLQLFAEEERSVRALGQTVIAYAEFTRVGKSALAVKVDIALKADRAEARFSRFLKRIIEQGFAVALAL